MRSRRIEHPASALPPRRIKRRKRRRRSRSRRAGPRTITRRALGQRRIWTEVATVVEAPMVDLAG